MNDALPVIELPVGTPRAQGRAHGEAYAEAIREIAAIRLGLAIRMGKMSTEAEVLRVAEEHLPVLQAYDADLYEELLGIAEGAGATPADIVVLNHYTDLRDISPARDDSGCTILLAPTREGSILTQTWDMHASAQQYTALMGVPARGSRPPMWLLTIVGCLGMAGLNSAGVAVTINNLKSTDAKVGAVWSAIVRKMLRADSAHGAAAVLRQSPVGSGHHYLSADATNAVAIETSGERMATIYDGRVVNFHHTNHCLAAEIAERSWVGDLSTTHRRYDTMAESLREKPEVTGAKDAWSRLAAVSMSPREGDAHSPATCSALMMNLQTAAGWACKGAPGRQVGPRITFGFAGGNLTNSAAAYGE